MCYLILPWLNVRSCCCVIRMPRVQVVESASCKCFTDAELSTMDSQWFRSFRELCHGGSFIAPDLLPHQPDMDEFAPHDPHDPYTDAMGEEFHSGGEAVDTNAAKLNMDCSAVLKVRAAACQNHSICSPNVGSPPALLDMLMAADKFEVASGMRYCSRVLRNIRVTPESALLYLELPSSVIMAYAVQPLTDATKQYLVKRGICQQIQRIHSQGERLRGTETCLPYHVHQQLKIPLHSSFGTVKLASISGVGSVYLDIVKLFG